jgi:hypothetical protein
MRRVIARIVTTAAVLTVCGIAIAADAKPKNVGASNGNDKIVAVDAQGNPVDAESSATPPRIESRKVNGGAKGPMMQRGQEWWPYQVPIAAPGVAARSHETLSEHEIAVNGVAVIDIRNPQAALARLPKELVLEHGRQAAAGGAGYYLVKINGLSRTQAQIDALERAGALLGEYMNINTYIARIKNNDLDAVRNLPFVTYVGDRGFSKSSCTRARAWTRCSASSPA